MYRASLEALLLPGLWLERQCGGRALQCNGWCIGLLVERQCGVGG